MSRGLFITFEGIEGSGKSTQLLELAARLTAAGNAVTVTREPGGTPLGQAARRLLLDPALDAPAPTTELFLYLADRAENVARVIRPALSRGDIVLADRHADATVVYQGVARGLGVEVVRPLNETATGGLSPDLTLLFDLPVEEGLRRVARRGQLQGGVDRLDLESVAFHERVRSGYLQVAHLDPTRVRVVPAADAVEAVTRNMLAIVRPWLAERGRPLAEAS